MSMQRWLCVTGESWLGGILLHIWHDHNIPGCGVWEDNMQILYHGQRRPWWHWSVLPPCKHRPPWQHGCPAGHVWSTDWCQNGTLLKYHAQGWQVEIMLLFKNSLVDFPQLMYKIFKTSWMQTFCNHGFVIIKMKHVNSRMLPWNVQFDTDINPFYLFHFWGTS